MDKNEQIYSEIHELVMKISSLRDELKPGNEYIRLKLSAIEIRLEALGELVKSLEEMRGESK